jgi:transmembrane sensor
MEQKTPWHIFFKSFQNQATPEELVEINNWLAKDVENQKLFEEVYHIFTVSTILPPSLTLDVQKAWDKVDQKIFIKSPSRKLLLFRPLHSSIAAIIVLGLLIFEIINNYRNDHCFARQYTEVITLPGQRTSVILPDGTKVWLNSASTVKYPSIFNKKDREIILTGEAFFEVHKDKSKRFRVNAGALKVDAYGTSFNIKNYPEENIQSVTVADGIVGISDNSGEIKRIVRGDNISLNKKSGEIEFNKENPELIATWKNGELIFRNTPVEEVLKSLESWYGVRIIVDKQIIDSHNYTFKIKTESFTEVLAMMQIMTPFEYKINGKDVVIRYLTK